MSRQQTRPAPPPPAAPATAARTAAARITARAARRAWRLLRPPVLLLGLPVLLVTLWWYASAESTHFLFPPLSRIGEAFGQTWLGPRLLEDLWPSVRRLAVGYTGALAIGIALGTLIGSSRTLRAALEPALELVRAIPPPVLVPIIALFTGIGDTRKVIVIIAGCVWPILLNTVEGVRAVDDVLSDTCRVYRIGGWRRLRHLVLRSASPQIVTGARQALAIGIILMVISELTGATEGIGYAIEQFQTRFQYAPMWSGVIMLGLLGVALSLLFQLAERRVLGWYHGQRAVQKGR